MGLRVLRDPHRTRGQAGRNGGRSRDLAWWGEANNWLNCQEPGSTFTADDLVSCIGKPTGSSNQIGARLRSWAMSDLITAVGISEAGRPESHGRILRVWQVTAWT